MIEKHVTGQRDALAGIARDSSRQGPGSAGLPELSTREAAAVLGLSQRSVRRAIASGALRATMHGAAYRIARDDLARFAAAHTSEPARPPLHAVPLVPRAPESLAPLPEPLSSFVGRARDVADVVALLTDPATRLVTITGPGGIGKTRLAIVAAAAARAHFPDGVAFIPLEALHQAEQVVPVISRALGLQESPGQSPLQQLQAFLRRRRLLLVLDNVEQLLPAAPEIAALLVAAPMVTALLTSRAPLRVAGEREMPLAPLTLPGERATAAELLASDAGRLFIERARAHAPDLPLDDRSAPIVAAICAQLDGLPLAIELAAARANILSPQQVHDRLELRLPILTRGTRDAPARHGAMRDAIAWSYGLLTPNEQRLFRTLSVFSGGFTLAAAEYVGAGGAGGRAGFASAGDAALGESRGDEPAAGEHQAATATTSGLHPLHPLSAAPPLSAATPPPSTLDLVGSLLEQNLLVRGIGPDGAPRFRMLETIREFGLEQLAAAAETEWARQRHASYYRSWMLALLPLASLHVRQAPLDQVAAELANLRDALEWLDARGAIRDFTELTAALGESWYAYGFCKEGQGWLERALARLGPSASPTRTRLLVCYAATLFGQGQIDQAEACLIDVIPPIRAAGDPFPLAMALILLGATRNLKRDFVTAEATIHEGLALAAHFADPLQRAAVSGRAFANLCISARGQHDFARATAYGEEALRCYDGMQFDLRESMMLVDLGSIACEAGDHLLAIERWHDGIARPGARDNSRWIAEALEGIASIATDRGDVRNALLLFGAAEALRERVGGGPRWPVELAMVERCLAALHNDFRDLAGPILAEGRALSVSDAIAIATRAANAALTPRSRQADRQLSRRELDVLHLLAEKTDREIAEALFLSRRTVNWHVRAILAKLGATSRRAAVTKARAAGIL